MTDPLQGRGRVLVVDDELMLRSLVVEMLEEEGFTVAEAEHGEAGLTALTEFTPDVVLLDLMMPVLDGWGFLERLNTVRGQRPRVIVLSAVPAKDTREQLQALGASAFVAKPFDIDALLELLEQTLRKPAPELSVTRALVQRDQFIVVPTIQATVQQPRFDSRLCPRCGRSTSPNQPHNPSRPCPAPPRLRELQRQRRAELSRNRPRSR